MAIVNRESSRKDFRRREDIIYGRVMDIILDRNHPQFQSYDDVGLIFYQKSNTQIHKRKMPTNSTGIGSLPVAKPLYPNSRYIPLKNEIVALYVGIGANGSKTTYYSSVVNIWNHPHHNALPTRGEMAKINSSGNDDYDASGGDIKRRSEDGDTGIDLGLYYSESLAIKPLIPFEGDFLLEGRFGNSIRFGSTNNSKKLTVKNHWSSGDVKTGDPITIIRNGQKGIRVPANEQEEIKGWEPTVEDPNGDDSSIYMTSNQVITDLKVAGLTDSEEPWITSWPSFGSEDIEKVAAQPQLEANQEADQTEEMTDEELNQAAAGEDETVNSPTKVDDPEDDDIIYYKNLPNTDEEAENFKLKMFCDYLFGVHCFLPLSVNSNPIYEIFERMQGGQKSYYPDDRNSPTHYITKSKLYEILVYYDVKISYKINPTMKLVKKPMNIGWLNSSNYFRSHVDPFNNTLHIPTVESIKFPFLDYPNKNYLDEAVRTMALDNVWSELAHIADIDINGFFGYTKDDWEGLGFGKIELIGERDKNKTEIEGRLIPKNSLYLKEEVKEIEIYVDEAHTNAGSKYTMEVKNIPGRFNSEKVEIEFEPNTSLNTIHKRIAEVTSNMLRVDHSINLRLTYIDASEVNIENYDNLIHYDSDSHPTVKNQLASQWLSNHDGRQECVKPRVVHVESMKKEDAEKAYEEEIKTQGETASSKPPKKYQNTETGVFSFRSEDWPEVVALKDNTNVGSGYGF